MSGHRLWPTTVQPYHSGDRSHGDGEFAAPPALRRPLREKNLTKRNRVGFEPTTYGLKVKP